MLKLKDFIKRNYVLFTVFSVILIVCISSLIIIHLINTFKPVVNIKNEEGSYFQILGSFKKTFDATIRKENDVNKEILGKDYSLVEISPIYYGDKDQIILVNDSGLILYMKGFLSYKVPKYSELIYSGDNKSVVINGQKILSNNYFIYDDSGNYIFMDEERNLLIKKNWVGDFGTIVDIYVVDVNNHEYDAV